MTQELQRIKLSMLAEIQELCGRPPVLSTENVKAYNRMMLRLIDSFMPRDFMEQMLLKHLADCTWEILRYTLHKSMLMDRKLLPWLEHGPQLVSATKDGKQAQANDPVEVKNDCETSVFTADKVPTKIEGNAVMLASAADFEHANALEHGIECVERLDKLLNAATGRRDDVLEQLDRYREGLGKRQREINAAEFRRRHPVPAMSQEEVFAELFLATKTEPRSSSLDIKQNETAPDESGRGPQ